MPIKFRCSACQTKVRVQSAHAGKRIACPSCKQALTIPAESTIPDTDDAGAPSEEPISAKKSDLAAATSNSSAKKVAAPAAEKTAFIKFKCPACEKPTGFPATLANSPASCPMCKAKIMVPDSDGGESFVIGGSEAPRKAATHLRIPRPTRNVDVAPPDAAAQTAGAGPSSNLKWMVMGTVGLAAAVVITALLIGFGRKKTDATLATSEKISTAPAADAAPKVATTSRRAAVAEPAPAPALIKESEAKPKEAAEVPAQKAESEPVIGTAPNAKDDAAPVQTEKAAAPVPTAPEPASAPAEKAEEAAAPAQKGAADDIQVDLLTNQPTKKGKLDIGDDVEAEVKKPAPAVALPPSPAEMEAAKNGVPINVPPAKPAAAAVPPAATAVPPVTVCAGCMGTGFIPLAVAKPYVWLTGMPAPKPPEIVPWRFCPKCQKDKDPSTLIQKETSRLAEASAKHTKWEDVTTLKLTLAETHHLSVRSQLPVPQTKTVATAIEQLAQHLQKTTGTTVLTQTLPDTHELLIFADTLSYNRFIDGMAAKDKNTDWEMVRKVAAMMSRKAGFYNANRAVNNTEHMPLFLFAKMLMLEATDGKAPPWLSEGFASYCENAVTNKNFCYSFVYELNDVKFGDNWNADIKKFATQSKLKPWNQIFMMDMVALKPLDYLTCYSMVCFLMKTDPQRFTKFVLEIRAGNDSAKAIEKVFGRKIADIQVMWANWAMTQK